MSSMRRLVFFGDSMLKGIYRVGMNMTTRMGGEIRIHEKPFPIIVGETLDVEVENLGLISHSNGGIGNDIFTYLRTHTKEELEGTAFVICWTEWGRGIINRKNDLDLINTYGYLTGRRVKDVEKDFERYGDYKDDPQMYRYFNESTYHAVRQILSDYNIPYLMTQTLDNQWFEKELLHREKDGSYRIILDNFTHMLNQQNLKEHWIEPDLPHNTIFDMYNGNWKNPDAFVDSHSDIKINKWYNRLIEFAMLERTSNPNVLEENHPYMHMCGHPNEKGHEKIAETLVPYIQEKLL